MHNTLSFTFPLGQRSAVSGAKAKLSGSLNILSLALLLVTGCEGGHQTEVAPTVSDTPAVKLVKPERRTITREVGQPSFIDAYEQTSMYAKLPGYILKWNVDIGDTLKKDQLMAALFIPELLEEHQSKKATVVQDSALVDQARRLVEVASGNYAASVAQLAEAKALVGKYDAAVERWKSEVERLTRMAKENVIDQQVLDESTRQLNADTASRDAAIAAVETARANVIANKATLEKSKVDVAVAEARHQVSQSEEQRLAALVGYTKLTAPYDGVVVVRNANTGDFVLPAGGDPSAASTSPDQAANKATPLYVVARTDIVRIYVEIPEEDANYVTKGTKAAVEVRALQNDPLPGTVTRTSWALHLKSRTLRAEIDLPNKDSKLLPGMYAYGKVLIERENVLVVPRSTVIELGEQQYCYFYDNGKAVRVAVQTGIGDDLWVEVTGKQLKTEGPNLTRWADLTGDEQLIDGDLTELSDGESVKITS